MRPCATGFHVAPEVGGGFGSKIATFPGEFLAIYCSMKLGRPVKKMIGGVEGWKDEGFELVAEFSQVPELLGIRFDDTNAEGRRVARRLGGRGARPSTTRSSAGPSGRTRARVASPSIFRGVEVKQAYE